MMRLVNAAFVLALLIARVIAITAALMLGALVADFPLTGDQALGAAVAINLLHLAMTLDIGIKGDFPRR